MFIIIQQEQALLIIINKCSNNQIQEEALNRGLREDECSIKSLILLNQFIDLIPLENSIPFNIYLKLHNVICTAIINCKQGPSPY